MSIFIKGESMVFSRSLDNFGTRIARMDEYFGRLSTSFSNFQGFIRATRTFATFALRNPDFEKNMSRDGGGLVGRWGSEVKYKQ